MNLQILNSDLSLHGIVTGFESVEFTRAFNTKGSFKIKINANNQNAKYIKIDKIVYIDEDKIGYIDKVTIDRKSDKAGEYIIAEGVELKDRLNRLIYPDRGLETDSYTGVCLETLVKSLINKNAGPLAAGTRQIPNLITAADQNRGESIDYSACYKDLSTEIYSLLSSKEMGLKATIDFYNTNIIFDVAQGNNLTASEGQAGGIVLSLDTKTALEIVDTDDKLSYKNLSVTAGLGEGADRTIKEVFPGDEEDEPTGYNRREVFTEARDIESDDELSTRGKQKLAEIAKTRSITAKANTLGSYQIADDYDLGDYISVDANGDLFNAQVTKLKYKFSKESVPQIEVVLNFDTDDTLISDISAKHMDYDALVASTSKGNLVAEVTLDTDTSSITIDDLDISADGGMYEIYIDTKNTSYGIDCRINGNTSDYYSAVEYKDGSLAANGSTIVSSYYYYHNSNAAIFGTYAGLENAKYHILLSYLAKDYVVFSSQRTVVRSGRQHISRANCAYYGSVSNITELTFLTGGTFGIGTVIKIFKR